MTGPTLKTYVHLLNPETGQSEAFGPDSVLPAWAIAMITNPKAWAVPPEQPAAPATKTAGSPAASTITTPVTSAPSTPDSANPVDGDNPKPPPKSGAGSGKDAWATYALALGAESIDPKATRDEIIAGIAEAGHPTE